MADRLVGRPRKELRHCLAWVLQMGKLRPGRQSRRRLRWDWKPGLLSSSTEQWGDVAPESLGSVLTQLPPKHILDPNHQVSPQSQFLLPRSDSPSLNLSLGPCSF